MERDRIISVTAKFSPAKINILQLLAEGLNDKQVAQIRGTTERTVKNQLGEIRDELEAQTGERPGNGDLIPFLLRKRSAEVKEREEGGV